MEHVKVFVGNSLTGIQIMIDEVNAWLAATENKDIEVLQRHVFCPTEVNHDGTSITTCIIVIFYRHREV
ncbi:MAG: hypothetical protein WCV69_01970 [Patescibacteria group bacterium]|jgi:hypothetical protein